MKKILSVLLAVTLIVLSFPLGMFTFSASALTSGEYTYEIDDNKAIITDVDDQINGKITIPETLGGYPVSEIGDNAFYECKNITEVVVPNGVTSIGSGAFGFCENLQKVTLPDGAKIIDKGAFSDCVKLTTVNIPDSVESIGEMAFYNCSLLVDVVIPQNVVSIGGLAFNGCKSLRTITIPDSVVSVGEGTFSNCTSLINVNIGNGIDNISKEMFYGCASIINIVIPDGIVVIGNSAFDGCTNLTKVYLPGSVKEIKSHAFDNCGELNDVVYTGDEVEKENITIELYNDSLNNATWNYEMFWRISATNGTGVYDILPVYEGSQSVTIENFNENSIIVLDKQEKEVKYYAAKQGWPMVKGQFYIIMLNTDYDETDSISWQLIKKCSTIFADTKPAEQNGWYNDAVTYSVGAGLITGYGGTDRFGTADNIQRQDFVVILARLAGVDLKNYISSGAHSFTDVPSGAYYEKAILWAADCGITTGYSDGSGKFGVGDKITREQLVTFLYRYAKYINGGVAPEVSVNAADKAAVYVDFAAVTDYAKEAVIWALENGVIKGQGGTHIAPGGNALRCEIAQIMYNIFLNEIF